MKELIQQVLANKGGDWTSLLTGKLGFSLEQATNFLPASLKQIFKVFEDGKVDISSLLGNGTTTAGVGSDLIESVDLAKIAEKAGLTTDQARAGLTQLMPEMVSAAQAKTSDINSLLAKLGDDGRDIFGQSGGIAGQLFGK